jgi:hypothetical protein
MAAFSCDHNDHLDASLHENAEDQQAQSNKPVSQNAVDMGPDQLLGLSGDEIEMLQSNGGKIEGRDWSRERSKGS